MARGSKGECTQNGIFPVLDSCRDYYHCEDWNRRGMQMYRFTCPPGTIFEDRFDNCHDPKMGTTRPGCENMNNDVSYANGDSSSVSLFQRHTRSAPLQENCTQEVLQGIAKSANGTCILIYYVDKYVTRVRSMIPVILPEYIDVVEFRSIVEQYNKDLDVAQSHTHVWRHGDDIMSGIRRTYELANLFAPEFQTKYQIMEERISSLKKTSDDTIQRSLSLTEDIERLTADIEKTTILLSAGNISELFEGYLVADLEKKKVILEEKKTELNDMSQIVIKTLNEMVIFMEFVKVDASQIEEKANSTRAKVKLFKDDISQDKVSFVKNQKLAQQGITNLEITRNASLTTIKDTKVKIDLAEKDRSARREEIRKIEEQISQELDRLYIDIKKLHKEASEELQRIINDRNSFGGIINTFLNGADTSASDTLKNLVEGKKGLFRTYQESLNHHNSSIIRRTQEITEHNKDIKRLKDITESEQEQISKLAFVDDYLDTVISEVEKILPLISDALNGLAGIEEIFDTVVNKLETLIHQAKAAKDGAERQDTDFVIYQGLSTMQATWNESYANIISLGKCTNDDFFHIVNGTNATTTESTTADITTTVLTSH